jgi:hypothetical protein
LGLLEREANGHPGRSRSQFNKLASPTYSTAKNNMTAGHAI